MANYTYQIGRRRFTIRVRGTGDVFIAKVFQEVSGEPVVVNEQPLEMAPAADEATARDSAIRALARAYPKPAAVKRSLAARRSIRSRR